MVQSLHEEGACRTRSNQRAAVGTPTPTRAHNEGKRAGADPCETGAAAHGNHLCCWSLPGRRHRAFSSSSFGVCNVAASMNDGRTRRGVCATGPSGIPSTIDAARAGRGERGREREDNANNGFKAPLREIDRRHRAQAQSSCSGFGQPAWFSWSMSNFESHGAYRLRARPKTHLKLARARCSFSMLARGTPWAGRYLQVCFAGLVY